MKQAFIDLIFNGKIFFENIQKFQITDVFEMAVVCNLQIIKIMAK